MTEIPERFPKVASPYYRSEDENGNYTIDPWSVKPHYQWVFDRAHEVQAIEKLDGTNCAVLLDENGSPSRGATRMGDRSMQYVEPFARSVNHHYITRAIQNSQRRGYFTGLGLEPGEWHFGEVVGPKMQGNPHQLEEHLFIPFEWLRQKCEYTSYGQYSTAYDAIEQWFRGEGNGLFSLFASRMHGQDLEASLPKNGTFVEGLIFIHPDFHGRIHPDDLTSHRAPEHNTAKVAELAKLRRDMFPGYYEDDWPMNERRH